MRKTVIFLLLLCATASFGQGQRQWTVVKSVILLNQTGPEGHKTLFVPEGESLYRVTAYMWGSKPASTSYWNFQFLWTPGEGSAFSLELNSTFGAVDFAHAFSPSPGIPVSFVVTASNPVPDTPYNLEFTVEELK